MTQEPMFVALFPCPSCGDEYDDRQAAEDCCYVNESCPARCTTRHEPPPTNRLEILRINAVWECPETAEVFYFCDWCGGDWSLPSDSYDEPVQIGNNPQRGSDWVCSANYHDIGSCYECGVYHHYDDLSYDEYGEESYCSLCYESVRRHDAGGSPGRCEKCGDTGAKHKVHPLTELVLCYSCDEPGAIPVEIALGY